MTRARRGPTGGARRGLALGALVAGAIAACAIPRAGRRLTGTCDGACAHYVACKPDRSERDRARCLTECPQVFSDPDSLMAYESLSCRDAVEYVDGSAPATAGR